MLPLPDERKLPVVNPATLLDDHPTKAIYLEAYATRVQRRDWGRCARAEPARGTWGRYCGRGGVIVSVNRQRFGSGASDHVEFGVKFTHGQSFNANAWFLPSELVGERPLERCDRLLGSSTTPGFVEALRATRARGAKRSIEAGGAP